MKNIGKKYIDILLIDPAYANPKCISICDIFNLKNVVHTFENTKYFIKQFSLNENNSIEQSKFIKNICDIVVVFYILPFESQFIFPFLKHERIHQLNTTKDEELFPISSDITTTFKFSQHDKVDLVYLLVN